MTSWLLFLESWLNTGFAVKASKTHYEKEGKIITKKKESCIFHRISTFHSFAFLLKKIPTQEFVKSTSIHGNKIVFTQMATKCFRLCA